MKMRHRILVFVSFGVFAALALTALAGDEPIKVGAVAPDFSLQDQDGRNVTLREFVGKTVVLEWFDKDCDYTKRDYKEKATKSLAEKYADKGVVWLAINSTRTSDVGANKKWAEHNELKYPVLDDATRAQARAYSVTTVPVFVIVDKHGNVAYTGGIDDDESREGRKREGKVRYVDRALDEITSGKDVTIPTARAYGCPLK